MSAFTGLDSLHLPELEPEAHAGCLLPKPSQLPNPEWQDEFDGSALVHVANFIEWQNFVQAPVAVMVPDLKLTYAKPSPTTSATVWIGVVVCMVCCLEMVCEQAAHVDDMHCIRFGGYCPSPCRTAGRCARANIFETSASVWHQFDFMRRQDVPPSHNILLLTLSTILHTRR